MKGLEAFPGEALVAGAIGGAARGAAIEINASRMAHIFRDASGHVNPATAASQGRFMSMFENTAANSANLRNDAVQAGILTQQAANAGVQAFTQTMKNGEQVWRFAMNFIDALEADRSNKIEWAAAAYEETLLGEKADISAAINLLVLYWQTTDYGFSTSLNLPKSFIVKAGNRLPELITEIKDKFGEVTEVEFWEKYIRWADLGEEFDVRECKNMLEKSPKYLEPAMFIYSSSGGQKLVGTAEIILTACRLDGTVRAKYVASVIDATKKHKSRIIGQSQV